MLHSAQQRFLDYDPQLLGKRFGVVDTPTHFTTCFFGQQAEICKADGSVLLDGEPADFSQTLSILDWLCDQKENAVAANEYCPVGSLPGVYVGGSGLSMDMPSLAMAIHKNPDQFRAACARMGGVPEYLGDLGYRLAVFPGLWMCLKFYFGDDEFPPQLTLLWDRNILQFVRYETVYYIAGCLYKRLLALLQR